MHTTLRKIRKHAPCAPCALDWEKLLAYLGKTKVDDEPLPLLTILRSNGFEDTLWTLRAVDGFESEIMWLAVEFARQVQHLMTDPRSITTLDVAEKFLRGEATSEELRLAYEDASAAAGAAAYVAAYVAYVAYAADAAAYAADAAAYAAYAADAAAYAADAAAYAADADAYAAYAAAYAADAAAYATYDDAYAKIRAADAAAYVADAARAKIRAAQEEALLEIIKLDK